VGRRGLRFSARRPRRRRRGRRGRSGIRRLTPEVVPGGHARAWGAATLADSPCGAPPDAEGPTSATGVVALPGSHVSYGWIHHDFRRGIKVDPPAGDTITLSCGVCPRDNA